MKKVPSAILCGNDLTAIGAFGISIRLGRSVPEDVSIIGCDNIAMASYSQPLLSTVRIARNTMGQEAFRLFDQIVASKSRRGSESAIAASFIARASSGAAPKARRRSSSVHVPRLKLMTHTSTAARTVK